MSGAPVLGLYCYSETRSLVPSLSSYACVASQLSRTLDEQKDGGEGRRDDGDNPGRPLESPYKLNFDAEAGSPRSNPWLVAIRYDTSAVPI